MLLVIIVLLIVAILIVYSSCVVAKESDEIIESQPKHIFHITNTEDVYKACDIIREKRIKKKYSQRYLGELCGVSHTWIYRIEHHQVKKINPEILINICNALKLDKTYILTLAGYYQLVNSIKN